MTKRNRATFSSWQLTSLEELKDIARARPHEIRVAAASRDAEGIACVDIQFDTRTIADGNGGLVLDGWETFTLRIPETPFLPPSVEVAHNRFLGFPHVLQGRRLCIYLDPSREWHPTDGMRSTLNRLWDWLVEAAAGRFNASEAMYHAVGGVLHRTAGAPTIVAREELPSAGISLGKLRARTKMRLDLTWQAEGAIVAPVVRLPSRMPFGASESLLSLLHLIDRPTAGADDGGSFGPVRYSPSVVPATTTAMTAAALRNPTDTPQYFVLAVPHPAGGAPHLLGGRLPIEVANALRTVGRERGTAVDLSPALLNIEIPIEWCNMSDERAAVTTRRDVDRPVNGFTGKSAQVWGCGGLGSWIAEFLVRAGVREITLCDPGVVTGGLLVRQNYTETSIGETKSQALAQRLRAVRDDVIVHAADGTLPHDLARTFEADVVIDATVSNAITTVLDQFAPATDRRALLAQVATDVVSGTLGILTVCPAGSTLPLSVIDMIAGERATADPALEIYHGLWRDPLAGDEIIPTRGCSVPTFHGSAADLAAVAGVLTSLLGAHFDAGPEATGTHLIALPHAEVGPRHHFVPARIERDHDEQAA